MIKIDQTFVRRLGTQPDSFGTAAPARLKRTDPSLRVIGAILSLRQQSGIDVVAQGVETPEQNRISLRRRCQEFQGFLFARPFPAETLRLFMDTYLHGTTDESAMIQ